MRPTGSLPRRSRLNVSLPPRLEALAAAVALLAGAGCTRSFDNPAQDLRAGEVAGRALAPDGAAVAGASVSVRGSALDQATRPTGRFSLLPLPRGRHTILLRQGQERAALREVDVEYGSGGQLEGISLGDLRLPRAAALSGVLSTLDGASGSGVIVDEVTGISASVGSLAFRLDGLPTGAHRLVAATRDDLGNTWVAGPTAITITEAEAGTEKIVVPMPLRAATPATGQLSFRVSSLVAGLAPQDVPVSLKDGAGTAMAVPAPDSNGDRDLTVPEGVYYLQVGDPASTALPAPPRRTAVVFGDGPSDLGTFIVASQDTLDAARLACHADADCGPPPAGCIAGVCAGYSSPAVAPATMPLCADVVHCWIAGDCGMNGDAGPCTVISADGTGVCLACHTGCTLDGLAAVFPSCP